MDGHFPESINQGKITKGKSEDSDPKNGSQCPFSFASLELLSKYGSRMKRLNGKQLIKRSYSSTDSSIDSHKLSTVEIMKIARARYIQESSGDISALIHPYQFGLASEATKDVELVLLLLVSAEKVLNQQFDHARRLLSACDHTASYIGNPVQRVVYYFAEALQKRIDTETGRVLSEGRECKVPQLDEGIARMQPSTFAYLQNFPFYHVTKFAGTQAILDSMASAKRIHLVDFLIGSGCHLPILMQALAVRNECPLEILKITAVGMKSKEMIEDTGRRLLSFANTMNLNFSFKIVMVSNMRDLSEDLFELEAGEAVGVYSSLFLRNFLAHPSHLESLIQVIKNLRPLVMVVTEVEANTCSPDYMDRFIEALFFYGANFDSFEACMGSSDPDRMSLEGGYFFRGIQDAITSEIKERITWHMKIDGWRAFLNRFGLLETELSMSSLYHADLVAKGFACGSCCSLDMDGKCLLVGWKGTPIFSLSAWKFNYEEEK